MAMEKSIYQEIAARTGGDIYVGRGGPGRTEVHPHQAGDGELVIPNISDPYRKERARDELPQSGSGKTIMTSGPKSCRRRRWRFPPTDGKAPGADDRLRGL